MRTIIAHGGLRRVNAKKIQATCSGAAGPRASNAKWM